MLAAHTHRYQRHLLSSGRLTHAGTAGVMADFSDRLGVLSVSSLSNKFLSEDMIRLEVIVAGRNALRRIHKAGNVIARPGALPFPRAEWSGLAPFFI